MSVQVKGSGTIGGLDEGLVVSGIVTASTQINVGSNIKVGSAGVVTATSFVGSGANLTGVLSNIVEDTSPQLGANLDTNTKCIDFGDSNTGTVNRLRFGASTDFEIFHNGTNNHIDCHTAGQDLYIRPTKDVYIQDYSTDDIFIKMIKDGAVELYYNDSKKLETTSSGITLSDQLQVNGSVFASAGLKVNADNQNLRVGAGDDLQLYHDGTHSRITNSTGFLALQSDSFRLYNAAGSENMIDGTANGSVNLYYDNSKKFETMSTGARIQGGLLFNSDTAAANTLDDYEEGTWTPDWRGSQALGTTSYGTYNAASYVKIGNQVTVRGHSQITGSSGGQGFWFINNLPFTCGGGDDRRYRSVGSVFIENFNFQDSETDILCFIERNNNDMQLRGNRDNLSGSPNIRVGMDSSFDVMWTITYPTT